MSFEPRFWSRVEKGDGCWNWLRGTFVSGYGQFRIDGQPRRAHRVSYELTVGPIPEGVHVLHRCDNRKCVNPDHLFLGTSADNMADKVAKGRQARGSKNGKSRLSEVDVIEIRGATGPLSEIGAYFGVSKSVISSIKNRKAWQHVPEAGATR